MAIVLLAALLVGGVCLMVLDVAGAKPAKAAAVADIDVSLLGDENDGNYFWEGQKEAWEKDADALSVQSGQARIFFVWPPNNGSHDVKLRKSQSTPGLTFPVSVLHQNYGTEDERWPAGGWKPGKAGTYALYCSKHTGMKMRVIVKGFASRLAPETKRGTVKRGAKAVYSNVRANVPARATVRMVACRNSSCSSSRGIYRKDFNLRAGNNRLRLGLASGLAPGRYQVQVVTQAETLRSGFVVNR